jgi:hypothetical protein
MYNVQGGYRITLYFSALLGLCVFLILPIPERVKPPSELISQKGHLIITNDSIKPIKNRFVGLNSMYFIYPKYNTDIRTSTRPI